MEREDINLPNFVVMQYNLACFWRKGGSLIQGQPHDPLVSIKRCEV